MSDHVIEFLGALLDGELRNGKLRKVLAHLNDCQVCQDEYQSLQTLSSVLSSASSPNLPSVDRFTADVMLHLPRKAVTPARRKVLDVGWWLIPVSLIAAWIFISTTYLVSDMVSAANIFGLLNNSSEWLVSGSASGTNYSAFISRFGVLDSETLQWVTRSENFSRNVLINKFWQVAIATFYVGWLAIWWVRHPQQRLGQPIDSGIVP